ncbi:MAG: hypothetical protein R6X23_08670 [Acidimicrobiia bacterium]
MLTAIVAVALFALIVALIVAVARDAGPGPADVAVAYEEAWDRLDFDALWTLSGAELRDGMGRREYAVAKRSAYAARPELGGLASAVVVDGVDATGDAAVVRTRLVLADGDDTRNELQLARRSERWVVVGYRMLGSAESPLR